MLKEFTKEIFTRYGFTENDIKVYLGYLRVPRATISEVHLHIDPDQEMEYAKIEEITNKLVEKGFLKKVEGIIDRYIPLEPFFELFVNESEDFRNEIAKIKDAVLADQSERFDKLEQIQDKSINEVETAVDNQVKAFFEDSDAKNKSKKERIDTSKSRFTDTLKTLESDLHANTEKDYSELTKDTTELDKELVDITANQEKASKEQESKIHNIIDTLNADLKSISSAFVSDNEGAINNAKANINKIIAELLDDFSKRLADLDTEMKKDLDEHVDRHKNIANELKPKMQQILEKYLERMDKVIADLKERISRLLGEHTKHVLNTTNKLTNDLGNKIDNRQSILRETTTDFKNKAITLLSNYLDSVNRFADFAEDMGKQGLFFTGSKKKKYKARWAQVNEDVASISRIFKDEWISKNDDLISSASNTAEELKTDVKGVMSAENQKLDIETKDLDKKAQETISAELETLAADLAGEIDTTLQGGVKDCSDTTIKLKDSLTNSKDQHHKQYNDAINRHKEDTLRHYTEFDSDIKRKNENWCRDVDDKTNAGKRDLSTEIDKQINNIKDYKAKEKKIIDNRLQKIRSDFDNSKKFASEKIDTEIDLWNQESTDMDKMLENMLEDHKTKYQENATTLQQSLSNTTRDTVQNVKDAIADFTLQFMNSIDDATELAETNEEKLRDIQIASSNIPEIAKITTWHTVGRAALVNAIKDAILRTKSSVIIVTPIVVPEVLQLCSEFAYQRKAARFMITSHWDMQTYGGIIQKMSQLGNIQFRQLSAPGEFYAVTRDAEEVILCPYTDKEADMISIVSNQSAYSKLYSQFIGPIFQANSRPIK
ncbi:MAG: helix-turn-helix domain-containing protein [Promethearchaeota archaeon]